MIKIKGCQLAEVLCMWAVRGQIKRQDGAFPQSMKVSKFNK